eukprot:1929221-Amphidinium_carterae.1
MVWEGHVRTRVGKEIDSSASHGGFGSILRVFLCAHCREVDWLAHTHNIGVFLSMVGIHPAASWRSKT